MVPSNSKYVRQLLVLHNKTIFQNHVRHNGGRCRSRAKMCLVCHPGIAANYPQLKDLSPIGSAQTTPPPVIHKAVIPVGANYDVVQQLDVEQFACFIYVLGKLSVLRAGRRIAGRMVVGNDDGDGMDVERHLDDVPDRHHRLRDAATEHYFNSHDTMPTGHKNDGESFHRFIGQRLQKFEHIL
jgi:hypothetical protein